MKPEKELPCKVCNSAGKIYDFVPDKRNPHNEWVECPVCHGSGILSH